MLQHSSSFTINSTLPQCCATTHTSEILSAPPYDVPMNSVSNSSCPKRDFQFRVIQVRQGPKWFIWPTLNHAHRKEKNENPKKVINNSDKNNSNKTSDENGIKGEKIEKKLYVKVDSGYGTGDQGVPAGITSPIIFKNNNTQAHPIASSPKFIQRNILQQITSTTNKSMIAPFQSCQCQCILNGQDHIRAQTPPSLSQKYQQSFDVLAGRLQAMQRTISVNKSSTAEITENNAVDIQQLNTPRQIQPQIKTEVQSQTKIQMQAHVVSLPSSHSSSCSPVVPTLLSESSAKGVFEILAVSKKDDEKNEEIDELELDLIKTENDIRFGNSGYSTSGQASAPTVSVNSTRTNNRSASVVEYYSNNGCYNCITGDSNIGQQNIDEMHD